MTDLVGFRRELLEHWANACLARYSWCAVWGMTEEADRSLRAYEACKAELAEWAWYDILEQFAW